MATSVPASVPGYSYDVNRSVSDELNFPGVVFTLGTPYVKVDETAKSCVITTKEETNAPDSNATKKINQVIGKETVIPINAVFKYIVNSYDFGIQENPCFSAAYSEYSDAFPDDNEFSNNGKDYGFNVYTLFFRRFMGDYKTKPEISSNYKRNTPNYAALLSPSTFITIHDDIEGYTIEGQYLDLFNGVAYGISSITCEGQYNDYDDILAATNTTIAFNNNYGVRSKPIMFTDAPNNFFTSYLGVKSITLQSDKPIKFKIEIPGINTLDTHNGFTKEVEIPADKVNEPFTIDIDNPAQAVLIDSATLYRVIRGDHTDPVTFRNFYATSNDNNQYDTLESDTDIDVNNYKGKGSDVTYTYGAAKDYTDYNTNVKFFDLDPAHIAGNKQMLHTGDLQNVLFPLGNNIHKKTNGVGTHLFANVFTFDINKYSPNNDIAKIKIIISGPKSYEESLKTQAKINITGIELSVYNDIVKGTDKSYGTTVDASINILIAGSTYDTDIPDITGDLSTYQWPTGINTIATVFAAFKQKVYNDDLPATLHKHGILGAGYCMAKVGTTLSQCMNSTDSSTDVNGDFPFNAKLVNNVSVVGNGVSILPCTTADPLIKIDQSSLTIDGYSVTDLNGYVKNVLSPDKHTIKFNVTAATGETPTGLVHGNIVFGVKVYNINELDNSSFNDGKYINLPTVKYETKDNQYVSYLLKINSNYIQSAFSKYNTKANISDIKVTGDASILTTPTQTDVKYYTLEHGKTATITLSLSNITDTDEITRYIARIFDICLIVNKLDGVDIEHPDANARRFFLSGGSNDNIIDNTDVVGYSEVGGIGTMFIQEGIKKSEDVPFLFDDAEAGQDKDIINVGDELPSEPLDQAMKLALNYRDLSIKVMPYTLVNYINTYSGAGTIESTGEMKDEYKPYLYDWHINDGLCLDKDTFVIDLNDTSSKCPDTKYWGTYKSTMSFIKSTLYERLDKMNPFEPIVS